MSSPACLAAERSVRSRAGGAYRTPLFMPVYEPESGVGDVEALGPDYGIEALMVNAFLLYKDRGSRATLEEGCDIHDYIGFHGLLMMDSGAFQGFTRPLYLKNKVIVRFQERIGADIVSPLDLISPPQDSRKVAERKLARTNARIAEAKPLVEEGTLTGVQQGGRFLDLRKQSIEALMEIGVDYIALGSLVPFFNRQHNLAFVGPVIREARQLVGPELPLHVYGAGEPAELPFLVALGADVFDSSSYVHYARRGWYMTPFGAVQDLPGLERTGYQCTCPTCSGSPGFEEILANQQDLMMHNLWMVLETFRVLRDAVARGDLDAHIARVLEVHSAAFPDSLLCKSWEELHA